MIVCTKCGMHNADGDTFCGQCGTFLEWAGEKVAPAPVPVPVPTAAPEPVQTEEPKPGMVGRVKAAIGLDPKAEADGDHNPPASADQSQAPAPPAPPPPPVYYPPAPPPAPPAPSSPPVWYPPAPPGYYPTGPQPGPQSSPGPHPTEVMPAVDPSAGPASPSAPPPPPPAPSTAPADLPPPAPEPGPPPRDLAAEDRARRAEAMLAKARHTEPATQPAADVQPSAMGVPAAVMPAARQPEAVKPAKQVNRPVARQVTPQQRSFKPGDLICGQCGEGNDPKRNFCHRCGTSLKQAAVAPAPKVSWWRRLFPRRSEESAEAGTRHGGGGRSGASGKGREGPDLGKIAKVGMAVALVGLGILFIVSPGLRKTVPRNFSGLIRKFVYHYVPISITKADAMGAEVPGHVAANVFQGEANSFWAAPAPKAGTKPRIRVFFDKPHDVALLRITSGDPANFQGSPRPKTVEYIFSDGKTHSPLAIENIDTPQKFKVSGSKATYVDIIIDDVYPVAGSSFYSAVSRIEVFQKKAGK